MMIRPNILCFVGANGGLGRRAVEIAAEHPSITSRFCAIFAAARDKPILTSTFRPFLPIHCHELNLKSEGSIQNFLNFMREKTEKLLGRAPRKISICHVAGVTDDPNLAEMFEINARAPARFAWATRNIFPRSKMRYHYASSILAGEKANYGDLISTGYMQSKLDGEKALQDFIARDENATLGIYYFGGIADTNALLRVPTPGRMMVTALRMRTNPYFWNRFEPHLQLRQLPEQDTTVGYLAEYLASRHIPLSDALRTMMRTASNADFDIRQIEDPLERMTAVKRREKKFNAVASALRTYEPAQRAICTTLIEADALVPRNSAAGVLVDEAMRDFTGEKRIYNGNLLIPPEESITLAILKGMGEFNGGIALLCLGIELYTTFFVGEEGEA